MTAHPLWSGAHKAPVVTISVLVTTERIAQGVYRRSDCSYHRDKEAARDARRMTWREIEGRVEMSAKLESRRADLLDDGTLLLHIVEDSVPALIEPGSRAIELSDHIRDPLRVGAI